MRNLLTAAACLASLAIFAIRGEFAVTATSPTFDEAVHLTAGYSYWRTGDFRINRETPPFIKLLWALPLLATDRPPFQPNEEQWQRNDIWRMGDAFLYESPVAFKNMLYPARRVNLAIGGALVALVGWWALRLWGRGAGVAAWAFAATDPNLLSQSAVLSTDVGLALLCMAAAYSLWEYAGNPKRSWFILAGVCLGLALATKYSAIVAVIACGSGALFFVLTGASFAVPGVHPQPALRDRLSRFLSAFVRLGLIAAIAIVPTYFVIQFLDWPRGLRLQLGRNEFEPPHYFLNGDISSKGWWYYFPEVLALKTPAGVLVLAAISIVAAAFGTRFTRRDVAFLLVPAVVFFLVMSIARINIGLRVVLPAYPILWLLAARIATLFASLAGRAIAAAAVVAAIVLPIALDGDLVGQKSIAYFNGLFATRVDGHKYLGDSNIDWGQGLGCLSAELRERGFPVIYLTYAGTARPDAYGIRYERLPGWGRFRPPPPDRVDPNDRILVAISVSNLQGTYLPEPALYRWLLEREPMSRTDGSIWLFDVTDDRDAVERVRSLAAMR